MYPTSAAARAAAHQVLAQHPDLLEPAQVIRLPGIVASYSPAVRLRFGAVAPQGIKGVTVLEAEPPPPPPPVKEVKPPKMPKPPKVERQRVNRLGQREKMESLLRRPQGVSSQELFEAMGVRPHTTRALLSRLRRTMTIERDQDGQYRARG
jgi:hypothetical protein